MQHLDPFMVGVVRTLCLDTNTPRSLTVWLLVKNGEMDQLFNLKTDPSQYLDPESYFKDVLVSDFLRKLDIELPGHDKDRDAQALFLECERQNCSSNIRLSRFCQGGPFEPADLRIMDFIHHVKKILSKMLGKPPSILVPKFGPGATFRDRGGLVTIPDKMSSRPSVTGPARCLLPFWEATAWAKAVYSVCPSLSDPETIRGNRFTTVPKDALKRRGICVEPSINVTLQLAVGRALRGRLLGWGIDLNSAQQNHRSMAAVASTSDDHSTIDLSNASDTVSYQLVKLLLPSDWFEVLDSLRSPCTWMQGRWHHLQKFSSMGNGFTFELETLLFLAISTALHQITFDRDAIPGVDISVFGDDIIVPRAMSTDLVACLRFFGLTPNLKKTFLTGVFKESCGGDFFLGVGVRPHFQKKLPNEPQHIIAMANGLRRACKSRDGSFIPSRVRSVRRAWLRCLDGLPKSIRELRGPDVFGDLVINDDRHWSFRETTDKRGFIRVYQPLSKGIDLCHWKPQVVLASALYGVPSSGPISRNSVEGYRLKWISCLERETVSDLSFSDR